LWRQVIQILNSDFIARMPSQSSPQAESAGDVIVEADTRKTDVKDEVRYHEIIAEISNHPMGLQAIRLVDVLNTKASALRLYYTQDFLCCAFGLLALRRLQRFQQVEISQ